jgi:sodium-dependent phosphate transporter
MSGAVSGAVSDAMHDIVVRDSDERSRTRAGFLGSSARITEEEFAAGMSAEEVDATFMFKYLLVFTAALESFAHGSNDTANATGPFSAVYLTYSQGLDDCSKPETPVWIMAVAGFGVFLGVATMVRFFLFTYGNLV